MRRRLILTAARNRTARRARLAGAGLRLIARFGAGVAIALSMTTAAALAEETETKTEPREPARARTVEEIEVLGRGNPYGVDRSALSRLPGSLQDTPQSITVIPEGLIEAQGATSLRDALRNVSGIGLNAGEGGVQGDDFSLRGYSAKNDIYVDGVRDAGSFFRDSFNLEAVEVFKGPTGSYFGRGSTGGVVNQVSKSPRIDPAYSGVLSLGDASFRRAAFDVNQPLGDTTAVRLNVVGQLAEIEDRDEADVDRRGAALSLATGIGTPTQWTLSYLYQEEDNTPDYGLPYIGGRPAAVDRSTFFGSDGDFEKTRVDITTLRMDHTFSDSLSLRSTLRYSHTERRATPTAPRLCTPPDNNCGGLAAALAGIGTGIRRNIPERDTVESILSSQTDVTAQFATGSIEHTLTSGFEISRETFNFARFANAGPFSEGLDPSAIVPSVTPAPRRLNQRSYAQALAFGAFVSDQISLTPTVDLVLGLRFDSFNTRVENELGPDDLKSDDREPSYRAGLVYKPSPVQSYYVSYGTSFNPSAETLTLAASAADTDPEETKSYEIGAKLTLLQGAVNVQGALFRIEKTDAREVVQNVTELTGSNRVQGLELGIAGRLVPGWTMFAGYTFLDAEVEDSVRAPASEGNQLGRTPRHSASLWTTVSLMGDRLDIGGGPTYVSHRFSNDANTNKVDGYVRWDASLGYRLTETVQLRMNVQNIADREFIETVADGHAVPVAGRTVVVSAAFSY
jgi:catecholate siderophore receptor